MLELRGFAKEAIRVDWCFTFSFPLDFGCLVVFFVEVFVASVTATGSCVVLYTGSVRSWKNCQNDEEIDVFFMEMCQ